MVILRLYSAFQVERLVCVNALSNHVCWFGFVVVDIVKKGKEFILI
jgi:hypothetical protein